ncbi:MULTISPECIES: AraC family transcriptional regulator [unclassified Wenzhouxiangella]|uniref:helix-turn-helix domain-containing protein n=1 Tax=unclassified Wenzhouxiangella TaxID=2613841 RepID=UPI000E32CBBC|nr:MULTISPECIES: helix-turn-helix transcriptional regulator [unclassified Wenzhouxiangella]RFF26815.1 AraC family transcriptional regulator [Wenzhouxiangella sp. 15181]RFP69067.1 AraC family transcriptional regulator [Wenzhouxiangella sp. 15190]
MAISHQEVKHDPRLEGIIQRVLTTRFFEGEPAEIPVPPSGAIYLNYCGPGRMRIRFGDGSVREATPLYCGGQLVSEMPVALLEPPMQIVGLEFTPTGFHQVFGGDCSRLTDRMVDLDEIDADFAAVLCARIEAASAARHSEIMQQAIAERLSVNSRTSLAEWAVARIRQTRGRVSVAELADEMNFTRRHLRRIFARQVGISPKQFAKIVQVNTVLAAMRPAQPEELQRLALEYGYYDQAHFIRDFTRHVGQNPTAFLASGDRFLDMYLGRKTHC